MGLGLAPRPAILLVLGQFRLTEDLCPRAYEHTYRARPEACSCSPLLRGQPLPTRKDQLPVKTLQVVLKVLLQRPSGAGSAPVFFVTSPDGVADSEVLCPDTHYVPVLLCSSGMPWDFKSWLGVIIFCSYSSSFSTHSLLLFLT